MKPIIHIGGFIMKRCFSLLVVFFILFFLSSCIVESIPSTPSLPNDDTQPTEPFEYQLTAATFESFFSVQATLKLNQASYSLELKMSALKSVSDMDIDFGIIVYFTYLDGGTKKLWLHHMSDSMNGAYYQDIVPMISFHPTMEPEVHYVVVSQAQGYFKTYQQVTVEEKVYQVPLLDDHQVLINDVVENKRVMDLWHLEMNKIEQKADLPYILDQAARVRITGSSGSFDVTVTSMLRVKPLEQYMEHTIENQTTIYQVIDQRLFGFPLNDYRIFEQRYYINPYVAQHELDMIYEDTLFSQDSMLYSVSYLLHKFTETEQGFLVEGYLKDFFSSSEYHMLKAVYSEIGVSAQALDQTIVRITYKFLEDQIDVLIRYVIEGGSGDLQSIVSETRQILTFTDFTSHDLSNTAKYYIYPPSDFDEITELTNVLEDVSQPYSPQPDFYITYFETGQYVYVPKDQSTRVEIYTIDRLKVISNQAYIMDETGNSFYLEAGYYFIKIISVSSKTSYGYQFKFEYLDYETSGFLDKPIEIKEGINAILIEGPYDFVSMKLELDEAVVLKIHYLNQNTELQMNYQKPDYSVQREWWQKDSIFYRDFHGQSVTFYFRAQMPGVYQFEVTILKGVEVQEEPYPEVTHEFYGPEILLSEHFPPYLMTLEIVEKSFVEFYFEKIEHVSNFAMVYVIDHLHQNLTPQGLYGSNAKITLHPGTYTIHVMSLNLSMTRVRADITPYLSLEIKHFDIESSETQNPHSEGFPTLELFHFDNGHFIQAWFTLSEDSTIFIGNTKSYTLHHASGEHISFYRLTMTRVNGNYYQLEAGTYYIHHINDWVNQPRLYTLLVAVILEEVIDDNLFGSQVPLIDLGTYTYQKDMYYDEEMVKFVVTETQSYRVTTNQFAYIYKADGTYVTSGNTLFNATLGPGTYYIWMPGYSSDTWTFTLQKN